MMQPPSMSLPGSLDTGSTQSMVGPILEILGSEAAYAERAVRLAILRAAFAIPVVGTLVVEDVATMRIDMLAGIVLPYASVHRSLCRVGRQDIIHNMINANSLFILLMYY